MKTTIRFRTYGQSAEEMLSKAIFPHGEKVLSKEAILFHAAPWGSCLSGVLNTKKAAKATVKKLERMLEQAKGVCAATGQAGWVVSFEIVRA